MTYSSSEWLERVKKYQDSVFSAIQEAQAVASTPTVLNAHEGPRNAANAARVTADRHSMETHTYTRNGEVFIYIFCRGCSTDEALKTFPCETFIGIGQEFKLEPPE